MSKRDYFIAITSTGITLVLSFFIWQTYQREPEVPYSAASPAKNPDIQEKQQEIAFKQNIITVKMPKNWGEITAAEELGTNQFEIIQEGKLKGMFMNSYIGLDREESGFVFVDFPYGYGLVSSENVPTLTIARADTLYVEKESSPAYNVTLEEKTSALKVLSQIYQTRTVDSSQIEQREFANVLGGTPELSQKGLWWGNTSGMNDRVGTRYYESRDSQTRGIGYFEFGSNGFPSAYPEYVIALLNEERKLVFVFRLPLVQFQTFTNFQKKMETESPDDSDYWPRKTLSEEYAFLDNREMLEKSEMAPFLKEVEALIQSLEAH